MSDIHSTAAALIAAAGIATPGVDLFIYEAPITATRYVLIAPSPEGTAYDEDLPGYFDSNFGIIVREANYLAATAKAEQIGQALNLHRHDAGSISVKRMRPMHKPITYRIPDSDDVEASVNIWAAYSESP